MEIAEYVRLIARRSRFVAFVAIAAAVAATLLFLTSPRTYVATTTVLVPTPPGSTSLFASVSQSVSDFEAAVSTDGVASQVASDMGLPPDDVVGVVEAERLSGSGVVELRYEHRDPELAEQVVEGVSREALILLLGARLEPFAAQLEIAQNQYDDAQADYDGFLSETGFINPEQVFLQEENEAQDLRNQIGAAITAGDDELAEDLQERLDEKTARNAPLAAEFQSIQNAQRRTDEALGAAQVANDQALGAFESVEEGSSGAISPSDAVVGLADADVLQDGRSYDRDRDHPGDRSRRPPRDRPRSSLTHPGASSSPLLVDCCSSPGARRATSGGGRQGIRRSSSRGV